MATLDNILTSVEKKEGNRFPIQMIHYTKLFPSEQNNYSVDNIRELAEQIWISGEVKQNLIARKIAADEYEIIAGHRRRLACKYLVEERHLEKFAFLPVKVEREGDVISEINLILTNCGQRERSDWEKMMEINRLTELLGALRTGDERERQLYTQICGAEEVTGRELRKIIAERLGLGETKVANLNHINRNLIPGLKERFKAGEIGVSVANVAAGLSTEQQNQLVQKEKIQIADAKALKPVSESDTGIMPEKQDEGEGTEDAREIAREQERNIMPYGLRESYCNAAARMFIKTFHDWMQEDFKNRVLDVVESEKEFKEKFRTNKNYWNFEYGDGNGIAYVNLFDDYIQFWDGGGKFLGNCEWFYLCAAIQSMWNVIAIEKAQETVKSIATSQQDDCPPGISYCIRQEWGTEPEQQEAGRKECGKCWEQWEKSHKNLVVQQEEREELEQQEIEEVSEAIQMEECNDLELLREMLRKEQNDLEEILKVNKVEPLPPKMVKKKKLLVGAIAGMICDLENIEESAEWEQELPELPRLVNNEERKAWLENYRSWGLWYEDTHIGVKYYKYDFDNGAKLIVEEYIKQYGLDKKTGIACPFYHLIGGPQVKGAKWSYRDRYYKYPNSKTELIEFLKELQKNGSNA